MKQDTKKYRDPFKGMSFNGVPVSKEEYIAAYESYVKRCSGNDEGYKRLIQKIEDKLLLQKSKPVNLE